jgi:tripartite-type tricarboxylate transporter receptor subunit TctC
MLSYLSSITTGILATVLATHPSFVLASESFGPQPVSVVAAFPPGGGADAIARLLQPALGKRLGTNVIVENKPGASGNIATEFVARSRPDGHTLLINNNTLTINSSLGFKQSFDTQRDLKPIAVVASTPIVIAVHSSLPVHTLPELVAYAKKQDGKLTFSSCGNGTAQHFTGVRFAQSAGVDMVHVPYKGCAPAVMDGLSGIVPVLFNTVPNLDAQVQAGKLRFIAVAAKQRLPFRPDLPTISETPGFANFEADVWFGLMAPGNTPKAVLDQLERAVLSTM